MQNIKSLILKNEWYQNLITQWGSVNGSVSSIYTIVSKINIFTCFPKGYCLCCCQPKLGEMSSLCLENNLTFLPFTPFYSDDSCMTFNVSDFLFDNLLISTLISCFVLATNWAKVHEMLHMRSASAWVLPELLVY